MNKMAPKDRHESSPDAPYWQALGEFVDTFALIESALIMTLNQYARVPIPIGAALFSGSRVEAIMSLIRRINAVADPGDEAKAELEYVFSQMTILNGTRNHIVHFHSSVSPEMGRIVTNELRVHVPENVKVMRVSPALLNDMTKDLRRAGSLLFLHARRDNLTDEDREMVAPALGSAWLYKPPPPDRKPRTSKESGPHPRQPKSRARPPQS